jgi:hypothetical protein
MRSWGEHFWEGFLLLQSGENRSKMQQYQKTSDRIAVGADFGAVATMSIVGVSLAQMPSGWDLI